MLKKLEIKSCSGLTALPDSLGALIRLLELDLGSCSGLRALPNSLGALAGLQRLRLDGCSGLTALPDTLGALSGLQELHLQNCCRLQALPESVGVLSRLHILHMDRCSGLTALPESLGALSSLNELRIWGCTSLTTLPVLLGMPLGLPASPPAPQMHALGEEPVMVQPASPTLSASGGNSAGAVLRLAERLAVAALAQQMKAAIKAGSLKELEPGCAVSKTCKPDHIVTVRAHSISLGSC